MQALCRLKRAACISQTRINTGISRKNAGLSHFFASFWFQILLAHFAKIYYCFCASNHNFFSKTFGCFGNNLYLCPWLQLARKGERGQNLLEIGRLRTLSSAAESRKFKVQEDTQRSVRVGCIVPIYYISRRGLTRVAYPCTRRCESPAAG